MWGRLLQQGRAHGTGRCAINDPAHIPPSPTLYPFPRSTFLTNSALLYLSHTHSFPCPSLSPPRLQTRPLKQAHPQQTCRSYRWEEKEAAVAGGGRDKGAHSKPAWQQG